MSGQRLGFLAVDENLHRLHARQVDSQRVDDGVDGQQLVECTTRVRGGDFMAEIDVGAPAVAQNSGRAVGVTLNTGIGGLIEGKRTKLATSLS